MSICGFVTLKERVEDPKDITLEKGREVIIVESKGRNDRGEPMNFIENDSFEIPKVFAPKFSNPGSFSIPCAVEK